VQAPLLPMPAGVHASFGTNSAPPYQISAKSRNTRINYCHSTHSQDGHPLPAMPLTCFFWSLLTMDYDSQPTLTQI